MRTLLLMLKKKDWGLLLDFARKDSWMICTGIRLFVRLVYEQGMLNDWYTKGTEKSHQHIDKYHCSPCRLITLKRTNKPLIWFMIVEVLVRFVLAFSYTTMNCDVYFRWRHLKCALMSEPMGKITVHHSYTRRFVDDRGGDKAYEPPRKSLRLSVEETVEKHYFD